MMVPSPDSSPVVVQKTDAVILCLVVLALVFVWILERQRRALERELDEFWQSRVERFADELVAMGYTEEEAYRMVDEMVKGLYR